MYSNSPTFNHLTRDYAELDSEQLPPAESTLLNIQKTLERLHESMARRIDEESASPPDQLLDINDVADYLNVSVRTVEALIADGELVPLRVRSARRFTREGVESYLRSTVRRS